MIASRYPRPKLVLVPAGAATLMPLPTVGERFRVLRERRRVPQVRMAEILRIKRCSLANIEANRYAPGPRVLDRAAEFFKVPRAYLAHGLEGMPKDAE
jgi:transcriptional regulator with XRE-family HTH domain